VEEATHSTGPGKDPGSSAQRFVIAGRYLLEREIARGAMGKVFLATELAIKRQLAVKVMTPRMGASSDDNFEQRFMLEARSVAALSHRNIVTVHDYGKSKNGLLFMAMEFLDGPTLGEALKSAAGPFPIKRACHIAVCVARALRAAHKQHLVHRDLKPGNVILLPDPDDGDAVKVLDFGLAKVFEHQEEEEDEFAPLTREGTMLGTPRYMAPEQIIGREITPATDLYALGACLYQMFAGQPPYGGASDIEILHAQLKEDPTPINELPGMEKFPPLLWNVVKMCLRRDQASRYPTAQSFIDDLRRAVGQTLRDPAYKDAFGDGLLPSSLAAALTESNPSTIVDVGDGPPGTNPTAELNTGEFDVDFDDDDDGVAVQPGAAVATAPRARPIAAYAAAVVVFAVVGALGWKSTQTPAAPEPVVEKAPEEPPPEPIQVTVKSKPKGLEVITLEGEVLGKTPVVVPVAEVRLIRFKRGKRTSMARTLMPNEPEQAFEVRDLKRRKKK
jgi:serine/threonine-protein kinase